MLIGSTLKGQHEVVVIASESRLTIVGCTTLEVTLLEVARVAKDLAYA